MGIRRPFFTGRVDSRGRRVKAAGIPPDGRSSAPGPGAGRPAGTPFNPRTRKPAAGGRLHWTSPGSEVHVVVGQFLSNTYVGGSQAYGNVYRKVVLGDDDRVLDLPEGRFVYTAADGKVRAARFTPTERHLFEHGMRPPDLPPENGWEVPDVPVDDLGERASIEFFDLAGLHRSGQRFGTMDYLID